MIKSIANFIIKWRWIWAITLLVITITLSCMPSNNLSNNSFLNLPYGDKLAHFIAYSSLGFTWGNALYPKKDYIIKTLIFLVLLGLVIEFIQFYFLVGRFFEMYDIIANIIGSLNGVLIFKAFIKWYNNQSSLADY